MEYLRLMNFQHFELHKVIQVLYMLYSLNFNNMCSRVLTEVKKINNVFLYK